MKQYKRRIKLIQPRLQLKLTLTFVGMSALALLLQFILLTMSLTSFAADLPNDGPLVADQITSMVVWILVISFGALLPLTFFVGVLATFRLAGPLYRIEQHLKAIIRGENPGACRIRDGDELQELCSTLNQAVATLRTVHTPAPLPVPDRVSTPS